MPRPRPLILLPPSETKAAPRRGRPLDLASLSFPELTGLRAALLDDHLRAAPTIEARALYRGVLFAALDLGTLDPRTTTAIVITSAQFGLVRPSDRIPAYRRAIDAAYWRPAVRDLLDGDAEGRVILDCRSSTYAAAWHPSPEIAERTIHVGVVEERDGVRRIVSHMAKQARGDVVRHLALIGSRPRDPEMLAREVGTCFRSELVPPARRGATWELTIILRRGDFVPAGFTPPAALLLRDGAVLEPLSERHNARDHAAWSSSVDQIHATPGFGAASPDPWPFPMSAAENRADLAMHARHFRDRVGFTYTVLDRPGGDVIGCVYIYPDTAAGPRCATVRSWVRRTHADLDEPLARAVAGWLDGPAWPFARVSYRTRSTA